METTTLYDVVYIGNYTKDTIVSPSGTRYVDGGGSRYAAHAAKRLGLQVAAVTRLKMDDLGPFRRPLADVEALIHARYNHGFAR